MLTLQEKLLFVVAVAASATYAFLTFRAVYRVIRRGDGDFPSLRLLASRAAGALRQWALEDSIWKARRTTSLFHIVVAWGFVFYFLVNFGDVVQGLFPITFLGEGLIGDVYRLLADLVTVAVLAGVAYLLLRRFVWRSPALSLAPMSRSWRRLGPASRDSLLVGLFILGHVGMRLVGESFAIAQHGADPFQPFGTALSRLWAGWGDGAGRRAARSLVACRRADPRLHPLLPLYQALPSDHVGRQLSDQAEAHVARSARPQLRRRVARGVRRGENRTTSLAAADGRLCLHHVQPLPGCVPGDCDGQGLSPSALEINKRYYLNATWTN